MIKPIVSYNETGAIPLTTGTGDSVNYRDSFTVNPDSYSPNYFVQVGPYYFSDLQQLLNRIKYHSMPTKEELINLIEETIKQGYKLKKDENI